MPSSRASASICSVLALERQIRVGDGDVEVLGHFIMIDHRTDRECDLGGQIFGFHTNITGSIQPYFDFTQNTHPVITLWDGGLNNTLDLSSWSAPGPHQHISNAS